MKPSLRSKIDLVLTARIMEKNLRRLDNQLAKRRAVVKMFTF